MITLPESIKKDRIVTHLSEEEAINAVLKSEQEPILCGDLEKLISELAPKPRRNSFARHRRP